MNKVVLAVSVVSVVCFGSSQIPRDRVATAEIRLQAADPAAPALELLGVWAYGPCEACAVDADRKFALIGNGETLQVLDIANPSRPTKIGEVWLEGNPQDIEIAGDFAYVMTLNYFLVVSLADLAHPSVLSGFIYSGTNLRSLAVSSARAYVAAEFTVDIFDVSDPYHPAYRGTYRQGNTAFLGVAAWGSYVICTYSQGTWPDSATTTYGVEVIDVSVASAPRFVGSLDLGKDALLRDLAVTADGYALVCQSTESGKSGGLAVIDIGSDPAHPTESGRLVRADGGFEGIALSGNVACVYQTEAGRLMAIDVSNPASPAARGTCAGGFSYRHMHASGGLVGMANAGGGISLYDIANPSAPLVQGTFDTPDGFGWGNNIAVAGDRVYMACCSDGLRIMDVTDAFHPAEESLSNDLGLDRGVTVVGNTAFAIHRGRLSIFDISASGSPERIADLDLPRIDSTLEAYDHFGIVVRPPYAYVSGVEFGGANDRRANLTIIDISDPEHPNIVKTFACPLKVSNFGNLAISGNYVYLAVEDTTTGEADRRCGLRTIDVSDPKNPREVSTWRDDSAGSCSSRIAVAGDRLYLTGDQLRIFDLADPAAPRLVAVIALGCTDIAFSGDFAYLALDRLLVLDLSNLAGGTVPAYYYRGETGKGIAVSGNIVYIPGSLSVFRNNVAPAVSLLSPAARTTVIGSVPLEVRADHDSGIRQVEFFIDGASKSVDAAAPYAFEWDTTPYPDGVHTVRIAATNNEGRSSELLADLLIRHVYAPLDFTGRTAMNRSLSQVEYLNILSWRAHPENPAVAKYRILTVEGRTQTLLAEVGADQLEYRHRRIDKEKARTYALVAVDGEGRESLPAYVTIEPGAIVR
jgi:hypothetical protein